jgi:hypothetical protein
VPCAAAKRPDRVPLDKKADALRRLFLHLPFPFSANSLRAPLEQHLLRRRLDAETAGVDCGPRFLVVSEAAKPVQRILLRG